MIERWQKFSIKRKILYFISSVLLVILVSIIFDVFLLRFSLFDFYKILENNNKVNALVTSVEMENTLFEESMKGGLSEEEVLNLQAVFSQTANAIADLPYSYDEIGKERYAKTWAINNAYEVYVLNRNLVMNMDPEIEGYVDRLYQIYSMQGYLLEYSRELMNYTIAAGDVVYQQTLPQVVAIPIVILVVFVLLLFAIGTMGGVMNKSLVEPVLELAEASKQIAENNFYIDDIEINNKDEIGQLVAAFNEMKYATQEYISALESKRETLELLHEKEVEKLQVETQVESMRFEVLKNQVNPHFLFNTLNIISGMATIEEAATTEKMTKALSNLFRYNLKTQDPEVTLSQELKVVEDYMFLQQMRFGERIKYDVNCESDSQTVMIPSFTLQPLVENCIIHGLSAKEEGGKIHINIKNDDSALYIEVCDDGLGMSEKELENLLTDLEGDGNNYHGIGLGNIVRRIKGMYEGGEATVTSTKGLGTTVSLKIPLKNKTMGDNE